MTARRPLVTIGGVLQELPTGDTVLGAPVTEAPLDGKQYARKDGAWVEATGGAMATFDTTLNFNRGNMTATASVVYAGMTDTMIVQAFYQNALDEVAVLNMRVTERSRTVGVGFEVIGVAPNGAFGTYNVRCIVSGT